MFLDRVKITIKAGDGGSGHTSFLRTKLTMNGGPDGGDGGKGGDIVFIARNNVDTLYSFKFKKKFVAENGNCGEKALKKGKDGKNLEIDVPIGTVIYDENEKVVADLTENGQKFTALKGGVGGRGNAYYATSTRQSPKFCQVGEVSKEKIVILELKTIADVGLVGYPNVGKSTLLSVISNANPKIANYPFTTLVPMLGVVQVYDGSFVVADIPGLIEGASEGVGLGHYFLKHVERVRLIVHMIDISESEGRDATIDYKIINEELEKYSNKLANLKQIVVFTKTDLLLEEELEEKINNFIAKTGIKDYLCISSITNKNIKELKDKIYYLLKTIPKSGKLEIENFDFDKKDRDSIEIIKNEDGSFEVKGGYIENLIRGVVLSDEQSFAYFQKRLKEDGVIEKLIQNGMQDGDTVHIMDISFDYEQ